MNITEGILDSLIKSRENDRKVNQLTTTDKDLRLYMSGYYEGYTKALELIKDLMRKEDE